MRLGRSAACMPPRSAYLEAPYDGRFAAVVQAHHQQANLRGARTGHHMHVPRRPPKPLRLGWRPLRTLGPLGLDGPPPMGASAPAEFAAGCVTKFGRPVGARLGVAELLGSKRSLVCLLVCQATARRADGKDLLCCQRLLTIWGWFAADPTVSLQSGSRGVRVLGPGVDNRLMSWSRH